MQSSAKESYQERFDRVFAEKEFYDVRHWDGETSSWSTKGRISLRTKLFVGAIFGTWFLVVFVFGFYKIVAG